MYKLYGYLKTRYDNYVGFITPIYSKGKQLFYQETIENNVKIIKISDDEKMPKIKKYYGKKRYDLSRQLYAIKTAKNTIHIDNIYKISELILDNYSSLRKNMSENIMIDYLFSVAKLKSFKIDDNNMKNIVKASNNVNVTIMKKIFSEKRLPVIKKICSSEKGKKFILNNEVYDFDNW